LEARDAHAAFTWLKKRQHGAPVGVIGISLGGAACLLGENGPLPADALVLQAVYLNIRRAIRNRIATLTMPWMGFLLEPLLSFQSRLRFGVWPSRLSPITALPSFRGPVLIIGGAEDRYTTPAETERIYAAAAAPRTLWLAPGLDHSEVCVVRTEAYREQLVEFFRQTIGVP
jgi:fermentation-respiration switch protein FrsA (DUF1100 family)